MPRIKYNRFISAALSVVMMAGFITPAFAADPNPGSVPVELTVQPANFSVTLPTILPVDVDATGKITVATNTTITNNGTGPISISSVKITPKNTWSIVPMDTDFTKLTAGTKQIGFSIFDKEVPTSGIADITAVSLVNGKTSIPLPYDSKLTTQDKALTEQPLDVLFTVGWYNGGNSVVDSPEALLALDKENLSMMVGAEETITTTFIEKETPKGRSAFALNNVDGVVFTSTDENVATVDVNGIVTAVGKGTAKVIATARGLDATCNITVNALKVPLTAIDVNKTNVTLNKDNYERIVLVYNPDKFDDTAEVTWSSSNSNVKVTPLNEVHDGRTGEPSYATITGIYGGNAVITLTVTSNGKSFTKSINVSVLEPMTNLNVSDGIDIKAGSSTNIVATKYPLTTTDTNPIIYESDDSNVATVDSNGLVTGISEGITMITVKSGYFSKKVAVVCTSKDINPNLLDYYTYTDDTSTGGYKLKLTTKFKNSLNNNINFTDSNGYVWIPGNPIPNPGNTYNGKPVTNMSEMFYGSQATSINLSLFDTSNVIDMSNMFTNSSFNELDLSNFDTSNVINMNNMFNNCNAVVLNLSSFNTSKVTNMNSMFIYSQVKNLDLSSFNTSNVIDMTSMFENCKATVINLSSFNTNKVNTMYNMFRNSNVVTLNLSSFDTSNVINMNGMFATSQISILDLSSFNTSNVTDMSFMFAGLKVPELDLTSFNIGNTTLTKNMFYGAITNLGYANSQANAIKLNTSSGKPLNLGFISLSEPAELKLTDFYTYTDNSSLGGYMLRLTSDFSTALNNNRIFIKYGIVVWNPSTPLPNPQNMYNGKPVVSLNRTFESVTIPTLDLSLWDTNNITDMSGTFARADLTTLDLSSFNTSNVTDMSSMFDTAIIEHLDLSKFDTTNVINMKRMFTDLKIASLNISSFNTSNVTTMTAMFASSNIDEIIGINKLDTSNATQMGMMFYGLTLNSLDLSNFNTSNVIYMGQMFQNSNMTKLDVSNFDTSLVGNMNSMFDGSQATTIIGLNTFDTTNVINMKNMFANSKATAIDVSNFNTSNVTNMNGMFMNSKTTYLDLGNFNTYYTKDMGNMFKDSLVREIDLSNFNTTLLSNTKLMFQNAQATTGYARNQSDADIFNNSTEKPSTLTFVVK